MRKGNPFRVVVICTIILAVLAAGTMFAARYISDERTAALRTAQEEANARNQERYDAYQQAKAEFDANNNRDNVNDAWPTPSGSGWEVLDLSSYPLEEPRVETVSRQEALYNGMLLVNQWHIRPEDFDETQMVSISKTTNRTVSVSSNAVKMSTAGAAALQRCLQDAKVQKGLDYYVAYEAYRTNEEQQSLYDANKTNIPAGCSDYNAGQSVRITLYHKDDKAINDYSSTIFSCEHGQWLLENSWRYGLVFRFPIADYPVAGTDDKSFITGVNAKMQTFRYVGTGNAAAKNTLGLCLEEYVQYLSEHPHIGVYSDGRLMYEICRQYVGDGQSFNISVTGKPGVQSSVHSLDNMGYVISVFSFVAE